MKKAIVAFLFLGAIAVTSANAEVRSGSFVMERPGTPVQVDPIASRANILDNPGFETGSLAPWTTVGWTVTNADQHSGTYSAQGIGNIWIRQDFTPIDVTTINSISVWEMQLSGIAFAAVDFIYSSDADYDEFLVAPGRDWTFIDMTSELRNSGMLSAIRFWSYSGSGDQTTWIDDVVIDTEGGPNPTENTSWGAIKALYR